MPAESEVHMRQLDDFDWVTTLFHGIAFAPATPIAGVPTDRELTEVVLAAGFTTCFGKPYRRLHVVPA